MMKGMIYCFLWGSATAGLAMVLFGPSAMLLLTGILIEPSSPADCAITTLLFIIAMLLWDQGQEDTP